MPGRLEGRVAIVTGAGCAGDGWGNGKAAAVLFAREGTRLLLVDRDADALAATVAAIRHEGFDAATCVADVSDAVQVAHMAAECMQTHGRIDVLLNNVGITSTAGLQNTGEAEWDRCFAVNVKSVFLTAKAVIPQMRAQRHGSIVNVSSIASLRTNAIPAHAYAASKAALNMLGKTLAAEFAHEGIRCNSVVPGMIDTPMVRASVLAAGLSAAQADAYDQQRHRLSPTGRQGSPWDIAHAALFLASDESGYINGTELVVDGGFSNLMPTPVVDGARGWCQSRINLSERL